MYKGYQCGLKKGVSNKGWKDSQATNNSGFPWGELGVRGSDGEFTFFVLFVICTNFMC